MVLDLLDVVHHQMDELMKVFVVFHLHHGMLLLMWLENQVLQNKINIHKEANLLVVLPGFEDPAIVFSTATVSLPTTEDMIG